MPFTSESAPSLWVTDEADAQRARQILADHATPANPTRCRQCGHDLRGLHEPHCPKCNTPFRSVGAWTCPDCKERIGTQFTNCWKCGAERGPIAEPPPTMSPDAENAAASTPCTLCGGTGRVERRLLPIALIAIGAFMAYAAIRDLSEPATLAAFHADLLLGRLLFAAIAIICFYAAARARHSPCQCTMSDEDS